MQKVVQDVPDDEVLKMDLEQGHAKWPTAIDQIIVRARNMAIPLIIIATMLPGRRHYSNSPVPKGGGTVIYNGAGCYNTIAGPHRRKVM